MGAGFNLQIIRLRNYLHSLDEYKMGIVSYNERNYLYRKFIAGIIKNCNELVIKYHETSKKQHKLCLPKLISKLQKISARNTSPAY